MFINADTLEKGQADVASFSEVYLENVGAALLSLFFSTKACWVATRLRHDSINILKTDTDRGNLGCT